MLGKTEGKRRGGRQRMRWLDSISDLMDVNLSKPQEIVKDRGVWCATVHGVTKGWIWQWLNSSNFLDTQRLSSQPYFLSGTAQMKAFFSHHQAWGNSHVSSSSITIGPEQTPKCPTPLVTIRPEETPVSPPSLECPHAPPLHLWFQWRRDWIWHWLQSIAALIILGIPERASLSRVAKPC